MRLSEDSSRLAEVRKCRSNPGSLSSMQNKPKLSGVGGSMEVSVRDRV